jgi:molybdopterin converting factor small subunit
MRIEVKLYGYLKKHAPGDRNHFPLSLDPGATLADLYRVLAIPEGRHIALVNGRRSGTDTVFADGDTLVIMPPISGG